ncbi:MAG TPA: hypothetical protein VGF26_14545, partial [Ramlibacter sp.]
KSRAARAGKMIELRSRLAAALAAALLLASPLAQARQLAAEFDVGITLHTGATCGLKPSGSIPKVHCQSGAFVFGAMLRQDQLVLDGDGFAGLGTTAEYRVVSTPQQQYLELVVGW